jgi:hypothetical protein
MAAIFRKVAMRWQGAEYEIKPTMGLINDIEQKISLSLTAQRMAAGQPPLSHIAVIAGTMLRSAGCKVTDEDIYLEISTGSGDDITSMITAIFEAAFPSPKKPEAPTSIET